MFQKGDCVKFMDAVGSGTITDIDGNQFLVADADGFEEWYTTRELAPCKPFPESKPDFETPKETPLPAKEPEHPLINAVVSFKNEMGTGVIIGVKGQEFIVKNDSGFEYRYKADEIIIYDNNVEQLENINEHQLQNLLKQELKQPKRKPGTSAKGRVITAVEVDLHIHELLESTAGMSKHDLFTYQMSYAKNQLERCRTSGDKRIVLIYGKGKGRLRDALWNMLQGMDKLDFYDASFAKYGGGAIEVKLW